jgi:tyrosine-protein phosphatase YwqE
VPGKIRNADSDSRGGAAGRFLEGNQFKCPFVHFGVLNVIEQDVAGLFVFFQHPERYRNVRADLSHAERLGRSAALVVDLAALAGGNGWTEKRVARRLVEEGLAHAVATDMHTAKDARGAAAGMAWIRKRLGDQALERLLADNPRRILAGDLP